VPADETAADRAGAQAADRAGAQAAAVARSAGVEIRALRSNDELSLASSLVTDVWGTTPHEAPISPDVLRALELSRNYVHGAFDPSGVLTGVSIALASVGEPVELHSHITGVRSAWRRSGVGLALKLHQRAWALERAIGRITWTFDPLVRANAVFNLSRLGAQTDRYLRNVYGILSDALNGSDETDRLLVAWRLASPAVESAASGALCLTPADPATPVALQPGPEGAPELGRRGRRFLCRIPSRIDELRRDRPSVAREWRLALRELMEGTLATGGQVLGISEAGDYVLSETGEP
jgi:predicted GNAT superfamily acetyltransferase